VSALLFSPMSVPAQASTTQTLGDLSGKWTFPKVIKMPKGNCGTFKATFKLGPRSLSEGTGSTDYGFSTLFIYTKSMEPIAFAVASWEDFALESNGSSSESFKVKFCKTDWQNDDGDFLAGISLGNNRVGVVTEAYKKSSEYKANIKVVK
jgi:hypothetical protein